MLKLITSSVLFCGIALAQQTTAHIISGPVLPTRCSQLSGDIFFLTAPAANPGVYPCGPNGTFSIGPLISLAQTNNVLGLVTIDAAGNITTPGNINTGINPLSNGGFCLGYISSNILGCFSMPLTGMTVGGTLSFPLGLGNNFTYSSFSSTLSDLTAQTAALTTQPIYTPASTGFYHVHYTAKITTAGSISSILGGTTGFVLAYTDADGIAQTQTIIGFAAGGTVVTVGTGVTTNTTTSIIYGDAEIYALIGVPITYSFGYTANAAASMLYEIHVRIEAL